MLYEAWKEDFLENLHVLSCFVRLKSVLLISRVFWILRYHLKILIWYPYQRRSWHDYYIHFIIICKYHNEFNNYTNVYIDIFTILHYTTFIDLLMYVWKGFVFDEQLLCTALRAHEIVVWALNKGHYYCCYHYYHNYITSFLSTELLGKGNDHFRNIDSKQWVRYRRCCDLLWVCTSARVCVF